MSVPFLVLLGGTRNNGPIYRAAHACEIVLIYREAITRSHILNSRNTNPRVWQSRELQRRERKRGRGEEIKETSGIKETEMERSERIEEDGNTHARETSDPPQVYLDSRGVSASHLSPLSLSRSRDLVKHPPKRIVFPLCFVVFE